jgi:Uma2 family endonuclease
MAQPVFESIETFTQAEFVDLVEQRGRLGDIQHYELLNGRVVMTPPAGYPHGSIEATLLRIIGSFVRPGRLGRVFGSSQGFELPSGDTVEPDVAFVSEERWSAGPAPVAGKFLLVVPDLIVEILSGSTASRDRGEKKAIYQRVGVREYWLVDSRARTVVRFVSAGERFDGGTTFAEGDAVESIALAGLRVQLNELFDV